MAGDQNTDLVQVDVQRRQVDGVSDSEWEVSETGSYCVTITDGCFPGERCALMTLSPNPNLEFFLETPSPTAMETPSIKVSGSDWVSTTGSGPMRNTW